jgi:uncharacterized protein (TIGR02117 family)
MRNISRPILYALGLPLALTALILLYLVISLIASIIPVGGAGRCENECVTVFVSTDYFHTDIIVPVESMPGWMNRLRVNPSFARANPSYLAFGFGDRDFYINTPVRAEFSIKTALRALLLPTPSVIHADALYGRPMEGETTVLIRMDRDQLRRLNDFLMGSFLTDKNGSFIPVCCPYFGGYDAFYEARESFHLFRTCNSWAGNALKSAGVKNALWTPFARGVFWHIR